MKIRFYKYENPCTYADLNIYIIEIIACPEMAEQPIYEI